MLRALTCMKKCANLGPGQPNFASMHITAPATSTESLDFFQAGHPAETAATAAPAGSATSTWRKMIEEANATPSGDLRRQRMEAVADRVHFDYHFVPNFLVVQIYGLSADLEWETPLCAAH